jgi:predicted metal-binding transcription factor (methanogenesis marker protein 9)
MKKAFCAAVKACPVVVAVFVWVAGGAVDAQKSEDTRTLVVIGSATVQGSNVTAARDAAIASSLMNAVALAAIEMLSPEMFAENFKKLNQQLLDRPDAYIQDFRLLSEAVVAKQHRVVVQATVATKRISDHLAGVGLTGGKAAAASSPLALTVEGSSNLSNFVKFRKALGSISGVEGIQVREMKPNETTLLVTYRGTAQDLATALRQQSFDTFTLTVADPVEGACRVAIAPK